MNPVTFHAHLDVCQRCRARPFDLCWLGRQLIGCAELPPQRQRPQLIEVTTQQEPLKRFIIGRTS